MQNPKKINVGILFGGKSAEHEVSLRSAKNVVDAINRGKYNPILIGINKKGQWLLSSGVMELGSENNSMALAPASKGEISELSNDRSGGSGLSGKVDVVFPILHGPLGEDGTVQGLLKLADVPFVGAGVLGSAVGMDKDIMKRLLRDAKLPIARFLVLRAGESMDYRGIAAKLGTPFFVKPVNMGSSVGVSKVKSAEGFEKALKDAFSYDTKIIIEENIHGREIECSVLGNENPEASLPGEVIPHHEFYSYEAKYIDENGAGLEIPAKLPQNIIERIQQLAVKTFRVLACEGLARVDFFLTDNNQVIVNEINTIPGFTSISMYPKLWEASGIGYTELIDKLIQLAFERFNKEKKLKTSYV